MNITEYGSAFAHRFRFGKLIIKQIKDKCIPADIFHHDIIHPDIFYYSTTTTGGFQTNTGICPIKNAIGYSHSLHPAGHLTTNHNSTVPGKHDTISDCQILTRFPIFTSISITSRFYGNTIVSYADKAIRDTHIATRSRVNTVCVGTFGVL